MGRLAGEQSSHTGRAHRQELSWGMNPLWAVPSGKGGLWVGPFHLGWFPAGRLGPAGVGDTEVAV